MRSWKVWAASSVQEAQAMINAVRGAYLASPGAMLVAGIELNPLEVTAVDGLSGQYYRVPVSVGDDGTYSFGAPIKTTGPVSPNAYPAPDGAVYPNVPGGSPTLPAPTFSQASRGVSARDRERLQAAIDRGALPSWRAAQWAVKAAAGEDISRIDQLAGGVVLPGSDKPTAAASQAYPEYSALFGPAARRDSPAPEYHALFGTREAAHRLLDEQEAAAQHTLASMTDDQLFSSLFPEKGSR